MTAGSPELRLLSRTSGDAPPAAPIRIVHLGLGSFFRSHQAFYTAAAPDFQDWGIAAFSGRSAELADVLTRQDGLYTLITRAAAGDRAEIVGSISRAHPGADHASWLTYLADPAVAIVTLTVTEAGYLRGPGGHLDLDNIAVADDLDAMRTDPAGPVRTMPAKLVAGLAARRMAECGALAVVSCDNLPDNGAATATVVTEFAALLDPELAEWIADHVSFVTTMVDRITPAGTDQDQEAAATLTGRLDAAPVVAEPYVEWVISGRFPAGRPAWDAVGANFVDDLVPYEQRKLRLLNGGHSLLAYAGSARGHQTIADAVTDPLCREWLEAWWDEACGELTLPPSELTGYRHALVDRFSNPRIRHLLAQIAADGSQKVPIRVVPTITAGRAAGQLPVASLRIVAAWINHLCGAGAPVKDAAGEQLSRMADQPPEKAVPSILSYLDETLAADPEIVATVTELCRTLATLPNRAPRRHRRPTLSRSSDR